MAGRFAMLDCRGVQLSNCSSSRVGIAKPPGFLSDDQTRQKYQPHIKHHHEPLTNDSSRVVSGPHRFCDCLSLGYRELSACVTAAISKRVRCARDWHVLAAGYRLGDLTCVPWRALHCLRRWLAHPRTDAPILAATMAYTMLRHSARHAAGTCIVMRSGRHQPSWRAVLPVLTLPRLASRALDSGRSHRCPFHVPPVTVRRPHAGWRYHGVTHHAPGVCARPGPVWRRAGGSQHRRR